MTYLRTLRRVTEGQLKELIAGLPEDRSVEPRALREFKPDRPHFAILDHIETERRVRRNWIAQCPSCAAAGRDRGKDNPAVSVDEPWKYLCWAGCTRERIRAALGAPVPVAAGR
jgi:hypothetical protein